MGARRWLDGPARELEASSRYLDLALAALLDYGESVHQLAARLLAQFPGKGVIRPDEPVAADALLGTHTKTAAGSGLRAAYNE